VTTDRQFKSPVEKHRDSSSNNKGSMLALGCYVVRSISQRANDSFKLLRKMLCRFYFGMSQMATGFLASDPVCLSLQAFETLVVSMFVAQYMAENLWNNWCAVAINAATATIRSNFEGSYFGRSIARLPLPPPHVDDTFLRILFGSLVVLTFTAQYMAQYMAETIWNKWCAVAIHAATATMQSVVFWNNWCAMAIHAVATTMQSVVVGPLCCAFEVATNALFAAMKSIFKIVKLILFAVFGAFHMAVGTATIFVLRAVFGFFFPSLLEKQNTMEGEWCEDDTATDMGPICFAFEVATNALFAVMNSIFKDVKLIMFAVFGAVDTAIIFVFRALFGFFFPSWLEEQEQEQLEADEQDQYEYNIYGTATDAGPIFYAFEVATNALIAVMKGIFKVVKLILLILLAAVFWALPMAVTFVLRAAFASFFPSLLEEQNAAETKCEAGHDAYGTATHIYDYGYESGTDSDDDYESEDDSDYDSESENEFYGHVATPAALRFRVDYSSY
jgi:hypothetical protein